MRPKGAIIRGRGSHAMGQESSYEALQSMLTGEYTEESTGARTIRQTGGKDRHSKVFTSRGPRDRRVRLSVATAIRFYDLQDRLGFEQPSKAVEWLLLHCQASIKTLPQLGAFHRPQARITCTLPARHLSDHSPPHIPAMDIKPSQGNVSHYKSMHSQYHNSQLASLLQHQHRIQDCFQNVNSSLNTHSFLHDNTHDPQDTIEEDPPQSPNPNSSGGSSDHPISLSKASQMKSIEHTMISTQAVLHPSPPCFSEEDINHHAQADNHSASFTAERNAACNGITPQEHQHHSLALSQRLLGTSNMMSDQDHYSVIESNTGQLYGIPSSDSFSLNGNLYMNMANINAPLSIRQSDFAMDNSGHQGTQQTDDTSVQRMMLEPASMPAEPEKSFNIAQSQQWRAGTNDVANETTMSFQVIQGDSLPVNMERLYGKMGLCGATTNYVSPSESNNTNIPAAAINYSNNDHYYWALKHALL